jgi:hypothetical protein
MTKFSQEISSDLILQGMMRPPNWHLLFDADASAIPVAACWAPLSLLVASPWI